MQRIITKISLTTETRNFDGLAWLVEGSCGKVLYPGTMAECTVRKMYEAGKFGSNGIGIVKH